MPQMPKVMAAMVTPFNADHSVDLCCATELAAKLVEEGNDGLVICGSTGEAATLKACEKQQLWQATVEAVGDRATVVAGTGTYSTIDSIELSRWAVDAGAHMMMLVVPYYNKPSQEGLYRHFRTVAESVDVPTILYNVPSRTITNLATETAVRLARDVESIVAIKEASGDMAQISRIRREAPGGFVIYSGNDCDTLPMLAIGGHGVISVASHLVGPDIRAMVDRFDAGDTAGALELHLGLMPVFDACFVPGSPNPAPLKAALEMIGFPVGPPRLPLVPPDEGQCAKIRGALLEYGLVS